MKKNKQLFTYKNTIILTNGSSIKIPSVKYIKYYQLNIKIFTEKKNKPTLILNKKKLIFT
jgi:hypothetical protein